MGWMPSSRASKRTMVAGCMALAVPGAAVEETDMRGCYTGDGVKVQSPMCFGCVACYCFGPVKFELFDATTSGDGALLLMT